MNDKDKDVADAKNVALVPCYRIECDWYPKEYVYCTTTDQLITFIRNFPEEEFMMAAEHGVDGYVYSITVELKSQEFIDNLDTEWESW